MPHRASDLTPLPHEAAELFRLMAEEIEETAIFLLDTNGVITVWNKAAEIMKGYRPEEAIGQFFGMLYTYEDQARGWPVHNIGEAIQHGYFREESWRKRKDDTLFWAHIALTALRDDNDRLLGFSKITLDLTAHKKLEQCLNEKEETRRILEAANAGTWKLDTDSGALEVSAHLNEILGYAEGDIGATLHDWLELLHPDELGEVEKRFQKVMERRPALPLVAEMRMRAKDGAYRWFYMRADWHRQGDGNPAELLGVSVDIHSIKTLADERERLFRQLHAERIRSAAILEQMPSGVFIAEAPSGKLIYQNQMGTRMLGTDLVNIATFHEYARHIALRDMQDRAIQSEEFPLARAVLLGATTHAQEVCYVRADGSRTYFSVTAAPIRDDDGVIRIAVAVLHDINGLKQMQKSLELEKERAQVTLAALTDGVITTDLNGRADRINPAAERLTGWNQVELQGRPITDMFRIVEEVTEAPIANPVSRCLQEDRVQESASHAVLIGRAGQRFSIEYAVAPIHLAGNRLDGAVLVLHDVTESRGLLHDLSYQASHDALTGLLNRREFAVRLQRTLDRSKHAPLKNAALLYLDLDQFKIINDTCGHEAGDDLLHQLAVAYRGLIRERDTLARIGGDEFALIVEHCTVDEALTVAHKVLETTRNFRYACKSRSFQVGVSIGLIPIDAMADNVEEALRLADHACYIAKEAGRNRVYVQQQGDNDVSLRRSDMQWVARLGDAFRTDNLMLYYQPIHALKNGKEAGDGGLHYEILLRMKNEGREPIVPDHFLPAAERYDVMPEVDRWVLRRSLAWLEAHPAHVEKLKLCTINLSRRTLADDTFQQFASDLLTASPVPANKLCFEITETGATANLHNTLSFIDRMTALGCSFALDDFGTGMASFAYLKQIPVNFVKIDGSFIQMMTKSRVDFEMVRFTNEISHLMNRQTIAEYVSDAAILQQLEEIGVDFAQGFWLGEPRPLEA